MRILFGSIGGVLQSARSAVIRTTSTSYGRVFSFTKPSISRSMSSDANPETEDQKWARLTKIFDASIKKYRQQVKDNPGMLEEEVNLNPTHPADILARASCDPDFHHPYLDWYEANYQQLQEQKRALAAEHAAQIASKLIGQSVPVQAPTVPEDLTAKPVPAVPTQTDARTPPSGQPPAERRRRY